MPCKNHKDQRIRFHCELALPLGRLVTWPGWSLRFVKNGLDQAKRDFGNSLLTTD